MRRNDIYPIIGEYISKCNGIEDIFTTVMVYHLSGELTGEKADLVVEHLISKPSTTFQTKTTSFIKLLSEFHSEFQNENSELLSKKKLNNMVSFRNKLAHGYCVSTTPSKKDKLEFRWINSDLKKDNYKFQLTSIEIQTNLKYVTELTDILVGFLRSIYKLEGYDHKL